MNNICIIDNSLSEEECDNLINNYSSKLNGSLKSPWNYSYYDMPYEDNILQNLVARILPKYKTENPEINCTSDLWSLKGFRFKKFNPGDFFDEFHSEQAYDKPRVLAVLTYLSDHNCGTEFIDGRMVKSVKGRSLLFPAFWTHAHKGQPCPENKYRYILSAYASFDKKETT
jgi:hypothetical protein